MPHEIMQKCSKLYDFSLIAIFNSHTTATWRLESNWKPYSNHPKDSMILTKYSFFTFEPAFLESIGDNHMVSDSVIKVTRITE